MRRAKWGSPQQACTVGTDSALRKVVAGTPRRPRPRKAPPCLTQAMPSPPTRKAPPHPMQATPCPAQATPPPHAGHTLALGSVVGWVRATVLRSPGVRCVAAPGKEPLSETAPSHGLEADLSQWTSFT